MTARPLVSIVIPTRDRAPRLIRTLRSALAQEEVAVEAVVVNDGSTDGTAGVLAGETGAVRVVQHGSRRGVAAARNAGIQMAEGEWIAFLDDDDLWSPRKVLRQLEVATAASASWVYGDVIVVNEVGRALVEAAPATDELLDHLLRGGGIPAGASNVIARTELVRSVGGFDERLAHLADRDLWIRLAMRDRPAVCPEALVAYIHHDENMHLDADTAGIWSEVTYLAEKHSSVQSASQRAEEERALLGWMLASQERAGRRRLAAGINLRLAAHERNFRRLGSTAKVLLRRPRRSQGAEPEMPDRAR